MWRWRRNPLRRRSDVIEAWIVLATWVLALVGSLVMGLMAADTADLSLGRQRLERHSVSAVLTERAAGKTSVRALDDRHVWVTVRWTAPDGSPHTGQTKVPPDTAKGTRVTVWTDGRGRLTSKPLSSGEVRFQAAWAGTLAAIGVGTAAFGVSQVLRVRLDHRRMREWADEWQRVDTRWGPKTG
ncbi:Rv1733c family protein [Streptomyces sp. 3213.3]|uniref:Rv1733c family protein n=1 Tax=Streptomyces sp. 3213.3 TaxID=1855348 RepID=UPI000B83AE0B